MKNKKLVYGVLSAIAIAGVIGVGSVSAHGMWGAFGNASPDEIAARQTEKFESEAKLLGVSTDEVKNAWAQGKTIQALAQEKGISEDQLRAKIQEEATIRMKAHLQTLVEKGVVTQAQADSHLEFMQERVANGGKFMGKGMMRHMF